ncbi:MAG: DUF2484 family protein [Pseudomonadota bacterium]
MTSLILFALWALTANVIAMLPSRDHHWTAAYILIAIGLPLLAYLTWQNGVIFGLIALIAGMSVLRWPVIYLSRWAKARMGR